MRRTRYPRQILVRLSEVDYAWVEGVCRLRGLDRGVFVRGLVEGAASEERKSLPLEMPDWWPFEEPTGMAFTSDQLLAMKMAVEADRKRRGDV